MNACCLAFLVALLMAAASGAPLPGRGARRVNTSLATIVSNLYREPCLGLHARRYDATDLRCTGANVASRSATSVGSRTRARPPTSKGCPKCGWW